MIFFKCLLYIGLKKKIKFSTSLDHRYSCKSVDLENSYWANQLIIEISCFYKQTCGFRLPKEMGMSLTWGWWRISELTSKGKGRLEMRRQRCETEILPARRGEWGVVQGEIYSNGPSWDVVTLPYSSPHLIHPACNHRAAQGRLWKKCRSQELQTWQPHIPWPLQCSSEAVPVLLNNRLSPVLETQQCLRMSKLSFLLWKQSHMCWILINISSHAFLQFIFGRALADPGQNYGREHTGNWSLGTTLG